MKAQKKPIVIDYFPYESSKNLALIAWIKSFGDNPNEVLEMAFGRVRVKTLEGESYEINGNHVIIRGVEGEYYPCEKTIFDKTYDKID